MGYRAQVLGHQHLKGNTLPWPEAPGSATLAFQLLSPIAHSFLSVLNPWHPGDGPGRENRMECCVAGSTQAGLCEDSASSEGTAS